MLGIPGVLEVPGVLGVPGVFGVPGVLVVTEFPGILLLIWIFVMTFNMQKYYKLFSLVLLFSIKCKHAKVLLEALLT